MHNDRLADYVAGLRRWFSLTEERALAEAAFLKLAAEGAPAMRAYAESGLKAADDAALEAWSDLIDLEKQVAAERDDPGPR